jgi:methionyl-tRNA synthetase
MKKNNFYVTTPIYYPSGNLHIGHAYTTTLADILARYKKEMGYNVFFLTGSDEHGLKIQQKAEAQGVEPKVFVDGIVETFKNLWKLLDIDYDRFIRTTDHDHVDAVQKIFTDLYEKDLIYPSSYQGKYCVSCEEFLTRAQYDDDFKHNVCGNVAIDFEEETYMLKVSAFKDFLVKLFATDFLIPEARKNEMLNNFILNNLEDLSVTRVSFDWGIKIKENDKHIIYVWLDALSNYITALGYKSGDESLLQKFWSDETEIVQLVGKEITRFHSIYWPVILNGLGLRTPDKLLSHGWILNRDTKMSKSIGNVVNPTDVINTYGSDTLRFYVAHNLPTDRDGNFTDDLFRESFNINLANNVGNLLSRTSNMIMKYFDGSLSVNADLNSEIMLSAKKTIKNYQAKMDKYNISEAVMEVLKLGQECNKLIEDTRPWDLEKEGKIKELELFLANIRQAIIVICYLLKPVLVKNYTRMVTQMGANANKIKFENLLSDEIDFAKIVTKEIIFERLK